MAFKGLNFMYANHASEHFGLVITSEGEGGSECDAGSERTLITDKSSRATKWELLGIQYDTQLTFDVTFTSETPLDRYMLNSIESWLLGQTTFQKLLIEQDDLRNTYYNCIFAKGINYFYNNDPYTIKCTAICDAPWPWEFPRKWKPQKMDSSGRFTDYFLNKSADSVPMLPKISFVLADDSTAFSIINKSFGNLEFGFSNLLGGEAIVIDCNTGIINSSSGMFRADRFNKTFLRLQQGVNELEFVGKIQSIEFEYQNARKVGV